MRMIEPIEVFESSGNVFADLGLPDPEERLAKAMLSIVIERAIEARGLTQAQAAKLLGTTQPKLSAAIRGQLSKFSLDRLFRFLNALGMSVRIDVHAAPDEEAGHLLVTMS
jgi:predicted XRE-type DNA-binding protein